ncbi:MAG: DUF4279 domain-containing protein [Planctomycetes bacterium]|nr:DUF4279 domain-containing protein [Planctomycetota bacterium]
MLGDDQKWYRVSLRFLEDNLDISLVTAKLGIKPDVTGRIGEHIGGNPRHAIYETHLWVHSYTEDDASPFSEQLEGLITHLEERTAAIRDLTNQPGVGAALFLGFSSGNGQGGFTLAAALLARISKLGLDLSLDLYPPTDVEA